MFIQNMLYQGNVLRALEKVKHYNMVPVLSGFNVAGGIGYIL